MTTQDSLNLHREAIIIDGLNASNFFDPRVFPRLVAGGVTAVNATVAAWHTAEEAVNLMADLLNVIAERADILVQARSVADIRAAKAAGRVGVIAGFQGAEPIGANLNMLKLYHALGVRIIQLTYNFQNLIGCGCQEPDDNGLSDFGRDAVAEMNRLGILIDLSHCGIRTTREAIDASAGPVAFTHANALALCAMRRNKSDEAVRAVAARGGMVGVVVFPPMLTCSANASLDDYVRMIDHYVNLVGVDHVGLGPDFMEDMDPLVAAASLKGLPTDTLKAFAAIRPTVGFESISACANVTATLLAHGYSAADTRKIMGENWLNLYQTVWK
ncbi:MAG: dipeptidase [Thermoflexales bacterium]